VVEDGARSRIEGGRCPYCQSTDVWCNGTIHHCETCGETEWFWCDRAPFHESDQQ